MKRLLLFGTDRQLAQFYLGAFIYSDTVTHEYRNGNTACYTCTNQDLPHLQDLADTIKINYELAEPISPYRSAKQTILDTFVPGEPFTLSDLAGLTGQTRAVTRAQIQKLIQHGYLEAQGQRRGRTYNRPEKEKEKEK